MGRLLAGLHDRLQEFAGGTARRQQILRQTCVANDSHQQVIEIVRNAAGQHADAFQFLSLAEVLLRSLAVGDVRYQGQRQLRSGLIDKAEADLQRELASALPLSQKIEPQSHWPCARVCEVLPPMLEMRRPVPLRQEDVKRLAQQLIPAVAKHLLSPGVDKGDVSLIEIGRASC